MYQKEVEEIAVQAWRPMVAGSIQRIFLSYTEDTVKSIDFIPMCDVYKEMYDLTMKVH